MTGTSTSPVQQKQPVELPPAEPEAREPTPDPVLLESKAQPSALQQAEAHKEDQTLNDDLVDQLEKYQKEEEQIKAAARQKEQARRDAMERQAVIDAIKEQARIEAIRKIAKNRAWKEEVCLGKTLDEKQPESAPPPAPSKPVAPVAGAEASPPPLAGMHLSPQSPELKTIADNTTWLVNDQVEKNEAAKRKAEAEKHEENWRLVRKFFFPALIIGIVWGMPLVLAGLSMIGTGLLALAPALPFVAAGAVGLAVARTAQVTHKWLNNRADAEALARNAPPPRHMSRFNRGATHLGIGALAAGAMYLWGPSFNSLQTPPTPGEAAAQQVTSAVKASQSGLAKEFGNLATPGTPLNKAFAEIRNRSLLSHTYVGIPAAEGGTLFVTVPSASVGGKFNTFMCLESPSGLAQKFAKAATGKYENGNYYLQTPEELPVNGTGSCETHLRAGVKQSYGDSAAQGLKRVAAPGMR